MRILPDGTVEIRNKKTGETRVVKPAELPNYGISYSKFSGEVEAARKIGVPGVPEVPVEERKLTEKEQLFKGASEAAKRAYETFSTGKVSTGPVTSIIQKVKEKISGAKATEGTQFRSQLSFARTIIRNALLGGQITPQEASALESGLPSEKDQEAIVEQKLKDFIQQFGGSVGVSLPQKQEQAGGINKILTPEKVETPKQTNVVKDLLLKGADVIPAAGGLVGGIAGGALGGGIGAIPGAGIGFAGGEAIKNSIRDILGSQDKTPQQQIADAASGAAKTAAFEAAGLGVGKFILQPLAKGGGLILKSLSKTIDDIPLKSIRINPSQLNIFKNKHKLDVADFMVNRGYLGEDAIEIATKDATKFQDTFDNLALNSEIKIPIKKFEEGFSKEIKKLAGVEGMEKVKVVPSFNKNIAKKILNEWESVKGQLSKMGRDYITPEDVTLLRRATDDAIPNTAFIKPDIKNTGIRLRRIYNDIVTDAVQSKMIPATSGLKEGGFKELGQELSRLYDFLEIADKQSGLGKGSLVLNLTRTLSGGGGGAIGAVVGGLPGAIVGGSAGLAAEGALRDPNVLKKIFLAGKSAQKVGKKISPALGETSKNIPKISGISSQALLRILGL